MNVHEFINGSLEVRQQAWYDWFCGNDGVTSRTKRWGQFVESLHAKFGHMFQNCEVFLKQNPGWHGNATTDTTLIQLYEVDYPPRSQRICMVLRRETTKVRKGWGAEPEVKWFYELNLWKEGEEFPHVADIACETITEFKKELKALKLS